MRKKSRIKRYKARVQRNNKVAQFNKRANNYFSKYLEDVEKGLRSPKVPRKLEQLSWYDKNSDKRLMEKVHKYLVDTYPDTTNRGIKALIKDTKNMNKVNRVKKFLLDNEMIRPLFEEEATYDVKLNTKKRWFDYKAQQTNITPQEQLQEALNYLDNEFQYLAPEVMQHCFGGKLPTLKQFAEKLKNDDVPSVSLWRQFKEHMWGLGILNPDVDYSAEIAQPIGEFIKANEKFTNSLFGFNAGAGKNIWMTRQLKSIFASPEAKKVSIALGYKSKNEFYKEYLFEAQKIYRETKSDEALKLALANIYNRRKK